MNLFITGIGGFIGVHLTRLILEKTDWKIVGLDINNEKILDLLDHPNLTFIKADCFQSHDIICEQVQNADVVLPMAAIANPLLYVEQPLDVFRLDFEENLRIVKYCIAHKKRIIFPSTSEVYGMSTDTFFEEEKSTLITGPINKERWIYSTSKQLLDRVIYAAGNHEGLDFTIFRPFNFLGPLEDDPFARCKSNRVIPTFISKVLYGEDITLVDGGEQKRCFVDIDDATEALFRIIENKDHRASGQIFNIGAPKNEHSIKEIAEMVLSSAEKISGYESVRDHVNIIIESGKKYYGKGYQDLERRMPSVEKIERALNWSATTSTVDSIDKTMRFYLQDMAQKKGHIPYKKL